MLATIAAVLLAALGIGSLFYFRRQPAERPVVRFQIAAPEEKVSINRFLALSPDGHRLALTLTGEDGGTSLWIRALDSVEMRRLPGTEGASPAAMPFWSPDARFIGFFAGGKLKKIDFSGGPAQTLCDAQDAFGGAWNRDGVIIFMRSRSGIWRVPEAGGAASQIIAVIPPEEPDSPSFLPDGRHFLYGITRTFEAAGAWFVATLDGSEKKRVLGGGRYTVYTPPSVAGEKGHLLFLREGSILMAQPFNEKSLEPTGDAFPVAENVGSFFRFSQRRPRVSKLHKRTPQRRPGGWHPARQGRKETWRQAGQLVDCRTRGRALAGSGHKPTQRQARPGTPGPPACVRRHEVAELTIDHLQQREGHWAIVDLSGKRGQARKVPVPGWVYRELVAWIEAAGLKTGKVFRPVSSDGKAWGDGVTERLAWHVVKEFAEKTGVSSSSRTTCAEAVPNCAAPLAANWSRSNSSSGICRCKPRSDTSAARNELLLP